MDKEQTSKQSFDKFIQNNKIQIDEEIYKNTTKEENLLIDQKPWRNDPYYFKKCKISLLAIFKMLNHAQLGLPKEVMGLIIGKIVSNTFIILDIQPLPVEGTETRVNPGHECENYQVTIIDTLEKLGRVENRRGWYHSHPTYGCWLSGIDVDTQRLLQQFDPQVAIVIDPIRTMASGKIEIGSFRTYPDQFQPPKNSKEKLVIPFDKQQDYGIHYNRYYQLQTEVFQSSMDNKLLEILWHQYWYFTNFQLDLVRKFNDKGKKQKPTTITTQELMSTLEDGKDYLKFQQEKNQSLVGEIIKNMLFSQKI